MGFASGVEAALLDSVGLFGTTRYLRLLQWSGDPNVGAGQELNEDGSLPPNMAEPTTGGYAVQTVLSSAWGDAVAGAPTTKQFPKAGGTGITYTPTGGASWKICGYAWTTTNAVVSSSNVISSGVMLDATGAPALVTVDGSHPLVISETYPIIERLGDPPSGLDPT